MIKHAFCKILQFYPILLIIAQKAKLCLDTPLIYIPPASHNKLHNDNAVNVLLNALNNKIDLNNHYNDEPYHHKHGTVSNISLQGNSAGDSKIKVVRIDAGGKRRRKTKVVMRRKGRDDEMTLEEDTCTTPDNGFGTCINVKRCDFYFNQIKQLKTSPDRQIVENLRKAHCGFEGNNPKVCCPSQGIPSHEEKPLPHVSTQTEPGVPSTIDNNQIQAPETTTSDYVSSLPETPVCGYSKASVSRVVGGINAKAGDFPWLALLGYKSRMDPNKIAWLCGGSLITNKHILSAAHCIFKKENRLAHVKLGEQDLSKDDNEERTYDINKLIMHDGYNGKIYENDIGLILLNQIVEYTDRIKPICLPTAREMRSLSFEGYNPLVAGWGDTEYRGKSANILQVAQVPVVKLESCIEAYSPHRSQATIDQRVLCAGFKNGGKDACQGDSGGPLSQPVWNATKRTSYFYQIGVVSFGKKCAEPGFPGVYTRVTAFMPWLMKNIMNTDLDSL